MPFYTKQRKSKKRYGLYGNPYGLDEILGGVNFFTNLLAHWKFDELNATDNLLGYLPNTNIARVGAPAVVTGKIGGGRDFGGTTAFQVLSSKYDTAFGVGNWSFCFWFKLANKTASQTMVQKAVQLDIRYNLGTDRFQVIFNGTTFELTSFGSPTAGVWYFICITHDAANNCTIYLNMQKFTTINAEIDTNSQFTIGAQGGFGEIFSGPLDSMSLWKDRLLSQNEFNQIYQMGLGGRSPFN